MNADFLYLYNLVKRNWCGDCDVNDCANCQVGEIKEMIGRLDEYYGNGTAISTDGCHICKDKKGKDVDVMFFDAANNMRFAAHCPNCGRKL